MSDIAKRGSIFISTCLLRFVMEATEQWVTNGWERPLIACRLAAARVSSVSARVAALIIADIGIARLGVNLEPLTFHGEIDGRDFILGLDRVVRNMINGDDELGHDGPSCSRER